jgi:hypothetical protein
MEGYTWTFSENSVDIFFDGKLWGTVVDTTAQGLPASSLEKLRDLLPNGVIEAINTNASSRTSSAISRADDVGDTGPAPNQV